VQSKNRYERIYSESANLKKFKPNKFFAGKPSQNYRVLLAIWDHIVLAATRHKPTHPALTPASEGWYSIYLSRRDGRLS